MKVLWFLSIGWLLVLAYGFLQSGDVSYLRVFNTLFLAAPALLILLFTRPRH